MRPSRVRAGDDEGAIVGTRTSKTMVAGILGLLLVALLAAPAGAGGATQVRGIAQGADGVTACTELVALSADYALDLGADPTNDLTGCLYGFVETFRCRPSGTYTETGRELYVDDTGTFETTYRFTAKFEDCATLAGEIHGRCQHPIVAGSGTGAYEGVTGRLDFKDDIEAGNFPYRGHLRG